MPFLLEDEPQAGALQTGAIPGVPTSKGFIVEDDRSDATKTINTGARATETTLAKIISGVLGMGGDLPALTKYGLGKIGVDVLPPPPSNRYPIGAEHNPLPTSQDIMGAIGKAFPSFQPYEPKTKAGQYADRVAVGAGTAAVLGGGSLPAIFAGAGGGAGSKLAADTFPNSPLAELVGGLLGGGLAGGTYSWLRPQPSTVARSMIRDARTPENIARGLETDSNRLGLGTLTAAESLNSPYGLSVQRLLEQDPAGGLTRGVMARRGPAVAQLSSGAVEDIAPGVTPREGAQAVQAGSAGAIRRLEQQRSAAGGPLFQTAFDSTRPIGINPDPVFNVMREIGNTNPSVRPILDGLANTVMRDRYGRPITDLEQLQNGIKESLDNAAGQARTSGQTKLARALAQTQERLLGVLDTASPEFARARAAWRQLSQPVNEAQQSLIGSLRNNSAEVDAQLRPLSESAKIFVNPKNETPRDITQAALALSQNHADAVPSLVKQYLSDKLEAAKGAVVADTSRLGARMNATTMGAVELEPRQAANVEAAIRALPDGARIWNGFERTMAVYRAQGNRYVAGSPTAYNQVIRDELAGNDVVTGTLRAASTAGKSLWDGVKNARLRSTYEILDRVLSSPDSIDQLRRIAREPNVRRASVMVGALMGDAPGRFLPGQPAPQSE